MNYFEKLFKSTINESAYNAEKVLKGVFMFVDLSQGKITDEEFENYFEQLDAKSKNRLQSLIISSELGQKKIRQDLNKLLKK